MAKKIVRSSRKSVSSKKPTSPVVVSEQRHQNIANALSQYSTPSNVKKVFSPAKIAVAVVLILIAVLLWRNKGIIIAGKVNNEPIWRWDLERRMVARSGNQVFEEMVNESLLKAAASKKGIVVTDSELNAKVKEIEKSLNGQISLADALAQQSMTMDEFRRQVGLQIIVEKLTADSVKVTDEEVASYVDQNKSLLTATDEAGLKEEAKQNLMRERQSTAFQKIFEDLKKSAKIQNYL